MSGGLTAADRSQLAERGISADEAERQLGVLRGPRRYVRLVRPCTVGDGVERLDPARQPGLRRLQVEAALHGRFVKFVPASGVASRMFADLLPFAPGAPGDVPTWPAVTDAAAKGDPGATALVAFLRDFPQFPFVDSLAGALDREREALVADALDGNFRPLLAGLLDRPGLGYASQPKGLIEFHAYPEGSRTSFEEHLVEAAHYVRDSSGRCRAHFTVSSEHEYGFRARLRDARRSLGPRLEAEFDVGFSHQSPATDTLALDASGGPARDADGRLILRPAGHGALLGNLAALDAELVFVKNIDNVQPDRLKDDAIDWKRTLGGRLVELQRLVADAVERLATPGAPPQGLDAVVAAAGSELHLALDGRPAEDAGEARRRHVLDLLDRPIRVCGVVRNTGEPGGGPFWVSDANGRESSQIVEAAEIDPGDAEQQAIFRAGSHFNPVDIACALRGPGGRRYDLERFVDPDRMIVARKSTPAGEVSVLERPGLWNGAMAGWNTAFVEVPLATFTPVKTVRDLLRDDHRCA